MFQIPGNLSIYICSQPVDFRNSFDGLSGTVLNSMNMDPSSGDLYVFYNKRRDRLKLLYWEGDGYWLFYKRLEVGTFELPLNYLNRKNHIINTQELLFLLSGIDLSSIRYRKRYNKVS